jgi:general secretion pathway protein K
MNGKQRGAALLTVLWLTVILTFIAGALSSTVRTEVQATRNVVDRERGYFLARGAIQAAALQLSSPPSQEEAEKRFGQRELLFDFETGSARVKLIPENAKFNLNSLPAPMLMRLLLNLGLPEDQARGLAVSIRASGDKAPFRTLEELLDVPGMTWEVYYGGFRDGARRPGLEEVLTLLSPGVAVDVNYAPREVLASIPGMNLVSAAAVENARAGRPFHDSEDFARAMPGLRSPEALAFVTVGGSPKSPLTMVAYGRARDAELEGVVSVLVEIDPMEPAKMRIRKWKE